MGSFPFLEAGNGKDRKADLCGWVVKQSTWARAPRNPPLRQPHPLGARTCTQRPGPWIPCFVSAQPQSFSLLSHHPHMRGISHHCLSIHAGHSPESPSRPLPGARKSHREAGTALHERHPSRDSGYSHGVRDRRALVTGHVLSHRGSHASPLTNVALRSGSPWAL